jgi:hypothetical protein
MLLAVAGQPNDEDQLAKPLNIRPDKCCVNKTGQLDESTTAFRAPRVRDIQEMVVTAK